MRGARGWAAWCLRTKRDLRRDLHVIPDYGLEYARGPR
jgi:hypothetical protein